MRILQASRALVLAAAVALVPAVSHAGIFVSIGIGAPPPLPVYVQPELPAPGYIWTPGYWAYDEDGGYYWVPGAWVLAPYPGALWTPGYWAFEDEGYGWNPGYWGLHVGFYGGVNYGCGYFGHGFEGGYWDHDRYFYNRSVTQITNVNVVNVYNRTVINNYNDANRVSFNGGRGGVQVRPSPQELAYTREQHTAALPAQRQNEQHAIENRQQFAAVNHGRPPVAVRAEPVAFNRSEPMAPVSRAAGNLPVNRAPVNGIGTNRGTTSSGPVNNRPVNGSGVVPARGVVANAPARGLPPTLSSGAAGQRPLITAHPVQPVSSRPQQAAPVYTQPRGAASASGYPARQQPYGGPQQTYNRPQPQAPVYSQRAPAYNPRPVESPQSHQSAPQPQYRPQPQYHQSAPQPQYRPQPQAQYHQSAPQPQSRPQAVPQSHEQSRPQEFHGGGGGHGGRR
jgi:hypothetical protein